ncbi:MAG: hypothetical protein BroJett015_22290 [Chloroflexota bacterium]|nr:MAG: hypothetical protein BroJett015_22290 [Chloroflexota bacterium]
MGFTSSTWTEHGQEIRAAFGASTLGNVTLPLSFTHKVRVKSAVTGNYYPWNGNRSDLTGFLPVQLETLQAKNLSGLLRD